MQSGPERPGSGFRLPSQYTSPIFHLVVFVVGGLVAVTLYRWISTDRQRGGLPIYRTVHSVIPPEHLVHGVRFRSASRSISDHNSEVPLLRGEIPSDLNADVMASGQILQPSELVAETTSELDADVTASGQTVDEDLEETNPLNLQTLDNLTLEEIEKILGLKRPSSGLLGDAPVDAREPFLSDFCPEPETTIFVSPTKAPLFEPLGETDPIEETSTSITNLVTASSARTELSRESFATVVKYILLEQKTGMPHTEILIPPAERLTKQIKREINRRVKAAHAYVKEDLDMAREVYRLSLLPGDPQMDLIIKQVIRAQLKYQAIDKSAPNFLQEQEKVKAQLRDFYSSKLPLTESKNLTAYFLSRYSGDTPFILKRLEKRAGRNEHHYVSPTKFGRIVYALDNSCHCFIHWIAYLETGESFHVTVAQSQNSLRYGRKLKSSSLPVEQQGSSSMQLGKQGGFSTRADKLGSTSREGKIRN